MTAEIDELERKLEIEPENDKLLLDLALLHRLRAAELHFEFADRAAAAVALPAAMPPALVAIAVYGSGLELAPQRDDVRLKRVAHCLELGLKAEAIADLQFLVKRHELTKNDLARAEALRRIAELERHGDSG